MKDVRKYLLEMIGTMMIVLFGCGVAIYTNRNIVATSLSFGLILACMYYATNNISGCNLNPAVSIALFIKKEISLKQFLLYAIFQFLGGIVGALFLYLFFRESNDFAGNIMQNKILYRNGIMYEKDVTAYVIAILSEVLLTFVFVSTVLGVTKIRENKGLAGIIIGLSLALVHLLGMGLTGTSVNPARSLGVAIFEGGEALKQVWIFIIAPLLGGSLAALFNNKLIEK